MSEAARTLFVRGCAASARCPLDAIETSSRSGFESPIVVAARTFVVAARTFVVAARTFVVVARTFVVAARTFAVAARTFVVAARTFVVAARTFVVAAHIRRLGSRIRRLVSQDSPVARFGSNAVARCRSRVAGRAFRLEDSPSSGLASPHSSVVACWLDALVRRRSPIAAAFGLKTRRVLPASADRVHAPPSAFELTATRA
ncbi:MAG: hypothetical protein ABJB12_17495 [Pseudomonadota bacterium]